MLMARRRYYKAIDLLFAFYQEIGYQLVFGSLQRKPDSRLPILNFKLRCPHIAAALVLCVHLSQLRS